MTPKGLIFTSLGLPVPQPNDIREWLYVDGLAAHGSLRMIKSLKAENDNLRDGLQATKETVDELTEANANQQRRIVELEAENGRLAERVKLLEAALLPFANEYGQAIIQKRDEWRFLDVTMPTKHFRDAAEALELTP